MAKSDSAVVAVASIAREIDALEDVLSAMEGSGAGQAVAEPLRQKIAQLLEVIVLVDARSDCDLAAKATLVLRWLDPLATDTPHLLCASLCRDVAMMFASGCHSTCTHLNATS